MIKLKWTRNEIKNQIVHMFIGLILSIVFFTLFNSLLVLLFCVFVGMAVELYQYFFNDSRMLILFDRMRDIFFYFVGGLLGIGLIHYYEVVSLIIL